MNIYSRLWILAVLFLALTGQNGSAQNETQRESVFDVIKSRMRSAADQNKELAAENNALKAQLVALQLEVEQYRRDVEELEQRYAAAGRSVGERASLPAGQGKASGGRAAAGDDPQTAADDLQRLRELRVSDLQYQKEELLLDLKLKEYLHKEAGEERRRELDALQKDIRENAEREKALSLKIADLEKAALAHPLEIELLKTENKELKRRFEALKRLSPE